MSERADRMPVDRGYLRREFSAMGTTVAVVAPPHPDGSADREFELAAAADLLFADLESRFSRFRPDSELARVNARPGRWTWVSRPFADLLTFSLRFARESGGLFDPTVLEAVEAAGYDRDWAEIRTGGALPRQPPPPGGRWNEVEVEGTKVRLAPGVRLDFGGVAKGWAVDRAAEAAAVLPWVVVSAGGDLRLVGLPPRGGVEVGLEDPADPSRHILQLRLEDGALATSSILSRTWGRGLHQIIDPRTSRSSSTGVLQATVWAPTCAEAEVLSTWAVLAGPAILDRAPGIVVMDDGRLILNLEAEDVPCAIEAVEVLA